jgi:HD-like signal output (HDOD) protein
MTVAPPPTLQSCVDRLDELQVFPIAAMRVLALARDPEVTIVQIEEAMSSDPVLAAETLSIANSAAMARKVPVRSLTRAVQVLGLSGAKELVLTAIVGAVSSSRAPWGPLLHRHALLTAAISRAIANRTPYVDASEAYVVGLLHDLGLQLLMRLDPVAVERLLDALGVAGIHTAERMRFGFTHAELSAMCIRQWGLPSSLALVVAAHHDEVETTRTNAARLVLSVADEIADLLADGATKDHVYSALKLHRCNQVLELRDGVLVQLTTGIMETAAQI